MKKEEVNKQIKEVVRPNGKGEINGNNLQETLLLMNNNAANDEDTTSKLNLKANQKETDEKLALKADKTSVYTKEEANALLDLKVNIKDYEADKEVSSKEKQELDVKLTQTKQELDSVKSSLSHMGNGVVGEAKGGSVINLPNNAMKSVVPNYKIEGLTVQNLVKNGDFSDGIKHWRPYSTKININDYGNVELEGGDILTILQDFNGAKGSLLCIRRFRILSGKCSQVWVQIKGGAQIFIINNLETGKWYNDSILRSNDSIDSGGNIECKFKFEGSEGNKVEFDYISLINLTQMFGAGNEPSKEWCDANLPDYVEGTKSVQTPMRVKSVDNDNSKESLLYLNNNLELKSVGTVKDYIKNGKLYKNISNDGEILEEPEVINLNTSGLIEANQNGTVFFEPITNLTGFYDNGLDVEGLDVLEVEEFSYLVNGVYQSLDVSKVKVEGGKLTHPDAQNGIVYLVYRYDDNPVWGENTISYYNSDKTLKSPNGKIWKKVESATDTGELVVTLEEVTEEIVEP